MKKGMFLKARKSFLGRVLRRLLGEEKGAVMMEYVVVGLLIAAAAVVIVGAFGGAMNNVFASLTDSILGRPDAASATIAQARTDFEGTDKPHSDLHVGVIRNNGSTQQSTVGWQ